MTTEEMVAVSRLRQELANGEAARVREGASLTQAEIASVLGKTPASVCNWESGRRRPRGETALAYARLLDALREQAASVEAA